MERLGSWVDESPYSPAFAEKYFEWIKGLFVAKLIFLMLHLRIQTLSDFSDSNGGVLHL